MPGRTISGTYAAGVSLTNPTDNPVTILAAADIANAGGVALQAADAVVWTIGNAGRISGSSFGVFLPGSAALTNDGTISASSTTAPGYSYAGNVFTPNSAGVLSGGGSVSNSSSGMISGYFNGVVAGNAGSVVNAGSIHTGTAGFGIVLVAGGGVSNASTGTITGGAYGIAAFGAPPATATNQGQITASHGAGIDLFGGGFVYNVAGAVTGSSYGVATGGSAASTVSNQAIIVGQTLVGVDLFSGGSLSNASTGAITGGRDGIAASKIATVDNLGSITGQSRAGVVLFGGGSVTNAAAAVLQGGGYGVVAVNDTGTLTNRGTITGGTDYGVLFLHGGYASNAATGTITGAYFGLAITNVAGSVDNQGSISSSRTFTGAGGFDAAGVDLRAGGTETNGVTGNIRATWKGVEIGSVSTSVGGTVFNEGTIFASNSTGDTGAAVWIHGPGLISNASTGTIAGGPFAIVAYYQTTLVNLGSIGGTGFAFDAFAGFANRVIVGPDARFSGTVKGGNSIGSTIVSALEFASGGSTGTITGLGSQFIEFADISIDPGAVWTASGANTLAAGVTLTDHGTLLLTNGTLSGGGTATISGVGGGFADATVSGAGALWAGPTALVIGDLGSGALAIRNQGTVQTKGNAVTDSHQGFALAGVTGAVGSAVVNGSKSLLSNTGRFVVGDQGLGMLSIEAGGTVITTPGSAAIAGAVIGAQAGADGSTVNVVGAGSDWHVTGTLTVGGAAAGFLAVAAGGVVEADQLHIAALVGGSGIVSVVGKASALSIAGQLTVGDAATAELSILNGATVSAADADIGLTATATGNVDIEGTGSHLDIAHDLNIGAAGVGVLTLGNGTELTVVNNLNIGANGVLNSFGGIIDPAVVNNTGRAGGKGQISASVSIVNSGTLFAANGTETLIAPIITSTGVLEIDANGNLAVNVGSVVATQTVTFTDGTGILTIGTLGGFAATIGSFFDGDSIVVQGTSIATTNFDSSTHVLTLFDLSNNVAGTLKFGPSITNGSSIVVNGVTPCFVAGSRISTDRGDVAVEDMRIGDRVQVVLGRHSEPVVWLGHRTVDCARHPQPEKVWPVRVAAHAFGRNRPHRDLWLSPDHALYIADVLIPVKHLINDTSVTQVPCDEVTYHHVELPYHSVLLAEGLAAESYLDTGDRANFINSDGPIALHPDFSSRAWEAAGCAPLVVTGPELEAARSWVRIAALAA